MFPNFGIEVLESWTRGRNPTNFANHLRDCVQTTTVQVESPSRVKVANAQVEVGIELRFRKSEHIDCHDRTQCLHVQMHSHCRRFHMLSYAIISASISSSSGSWYESKADQTDKQQFEQCNDKLISIKRNK